MESTSTPVQRFIQEMVPLLADHMLVLRRLSAAVLVSRSDFMTQWKGVMEQTRAQSRLDRMRSTETLNHAVTVLLDGAANSQGAPLQNYLQMIAAWSAELSASGFDYAELFAFWMTYRRALLPLVLREFPAGPELSLAMTALDAQERAFLGISALMSVQVAHEQLTQGVHQRSVGRLAGGVTHALNNTMAVIVGRAQIIEEQIADEELRQELLAIQRIARAGADALKRLYQFSADRDGNDLTRVDVNHIVNDVIQITRFRWRDDAEASGIAIDVLKDLDTVPQVWARASQLRDVLVELILNSVEAMPLGGVVTLRTERAGEQVLILVTDQGAGMEATTRARATEPFFTTKGPGHVGLGLATAANLLRQMNGSLQIESVPGQGTTVRIALPIAEQASAPADARQARLARWASILVVDDEPAVRDVTARTFQLRGFHVVAAESGADALRLFNEHGPFQVAIVDLGMPRMNGFELARALKEVNAKTIVILMTGWAAELDTKKMRESGIDRAISKPFDVDQVIQLISEALAIQEKK